MDHEQEYSRRALLTLGAVAVLSPMLRLLPVQSVQTAGRGVWLSALMAAPLMLGYALFLCTFLSRRQEGEGLEELILRSLGDRVGKAALCLLSAWLLLYAGFVLRSGSDRLVVTVFSSSAPAPFSLVMGASALPAVLSKRQTLVRFSQVVRPLVYGTLLVLLFFALLSVDTANLLPLSADLLLPALCGSLGAVDVLSLGFFAMGLLVGGIKKGRGAYRSLALWIGFLSVVMALLGLAVVGCFGAELSSMLTHPFFALVRNLVFFRSLERVEALIVMLWIFPDYLLFSLFVRAAAESLGRVFNLKGRWLPALSLIAALCVSLLIAPEVRGMELWSRRIVPGINLTLCFLFLPGVYLTGRLRKRI